MEVSIAGKGLDLGNAFPEHIRDQVPPTVRKYFEGASSAVVLVRKDADEFTVEINVHVNKRVFMKAKGAMADPYAAFHKALVHLSKRLRRYKRRLRDDHRAPPKTIAANSYVIGMPDFSDDDADDILRREGESAVDAASFAGPHPEDPENDEKPLIIAETVEDVERLSVNDAVMRMDLLGLQQMIFQEAGSGRINMVYRRADGNVGWIDPKPNGKPLERD